MLLKFRWLLRQLLLSTHCLICGENRTTDTLLCHECWCKLEFINEHTACECCGSFIPATENIVAKRLLSNCDLCVLEKPNYKKLYSALIYNDIASKIISDFKYRDRTDLLKIVSDLMINRIRQERQIDGKSKFVHYDIICPVPMHFLRMIYRKFNQSAMIASDIYQEIKTIKTNSGSNAVEDSLLNEKNSIVYIPNLLIRVRHTKPQALMLKNERETNLIGAFEMNKKYQQQIKNKNVLLVDDIVTTGSTIKNCIIALLKNGAKSVDVICFAKTTF
jgi:predicted amidophosphoribosyltransferase